MKRNLSFVMACSLLATHATPLLAWSSGDRGPSFYISWWKLLLFWLLFLLWVKASAWVNQAGTRLSRTASFNYTMANLIFTLPFAACFAIFAFLLPIPGIAGFAVSFSVLAIGYIVALVAFATKYNGLVLEGEKVFTSAHIKFWISNIGNRAAPEREVLHAHEQGAQIDFAVTATENKGEQQALLISSRQSEGFVQAKGIIADAIDRRADRVLLDYTGQGVSRRYEIDGIWQEGEMGERELLDPALASLKIICKLNPEDRRTRQESKFQLKYNKKKYKAILSSQGTQTGERVVVALEGPKADLSTLASLGMRDKMSEQLLDVLRTPGIVLISSMPHGGLTTTWASTLTATDRMLRDFISVEDEADPTPYVENIEIVKFNAAGGETPMTLLPKQLLRQPDAVVVPDLNDAATVSTLADQAANQERLVVGGVRAKEAVEALLRVMLLKPDNVQEFVQNVKAVLNVRLVRRLCDTCKVGYVPPPQLMQQLGIPAGRIAELFREWQPNPEEAKKRIPPGACEFCGLEGPSCSGLAYLGRVGIFELLIVDDKLREALLKQPKLEVLRQVAKQSGHRSLKEEGIFLVARGVTSLNELQRVLSQ
jgi:type II secretory ATPase GspE/PulE/Tfp pilus assembly ATPase PilB-like protein